MANRKPVRFWIVVVATSLLVAALPSFARPLLAQQQPGAAAPAAPESAAAQPQITSNTGRSYVFDYILIVFFFGAALFAICRSSNRS